MNRYLYICAVLTAFLAGGTAVFAQGGYGISGSVVDKDGPVIGAAVVEQGHQTVHLPTLTEIIPLL